MEWTDIRLTVAHRDAEQAEAAATMIAEGGIYIEDYSDLEEQVAEIAHVDLIEPELLEKPRDVVVIHIYLEPGAQPAETLAAIDARMEAAGIAYTVETGSGCCGAPAGPWAPAGMSPPASASRRWTSWSPAGSGCWTSAPAAAFWPLRPSSWARPRPKGSTSTRWRSAPPARAPP